MKKYSSNLLGDFFSINPNYLLIKIFIFREFNVSNSNFDLTLFFFYHYLHHRNVHKYIVNKSQDFA